MKINKSRLQEMAQEELEGLVSEQARQTPEEIKMVMANPKMFPAAYKDLQAQMLAAKGVSDEKKPPEPKVEPIPAGFRRGAESEEKPVTKTTTRRRRSSWDPKRNKPRSAIIKSTTVPIQNVNTGEITNQPLEDVVTSDDPEYREKQKKRVGNWEQNRQNTRAIMRGKQGDWGTHLRPARGTRKAIETERDPYIRESQLKQIIEEEIQSIVQEGTNGFGGRRARHTKGLNLAWTQPADVLGFGTEEQTIDPQTGAGAGQSRHATADEIAQRYNQGGRFRHSRRVQDSAGDSAAYWGAQEGSIGYQTPNVPTGDELRQTPMMSFAPEVTTDPFAPEDRTGVGHTPLRPETAKEASEGIPRTEAEHQHQRTTGRWDIQEGLKINKSRLQRIIQEEIQSIVQEGTNGFGDPGAGPEIRFPPGGKNGFGGQRTGSRSTKKYGKESRGDLPGPAQKQREKQRAGPSPKSWQDAHNDAAQKKLPPVKVTGPRRHDPAIVADEEAAQAADHARARSLVGQSQGGGVDVESPEGGAFPTQSSIDYLANLEEHTLNQTIQEELQKVLQEEWRMGIDRSWERPGEPAPIKLKPEEIVTLQGVDRPDEDMRTLFRLAMNGDPESQDLLQLISPSKFGPPGMPFDVIPVKQPPPGGWPQN